MTDHISLMESASDMDPQAVLNALIAGGGVEQLEIEGVRNSEAGNDVERVMEGEPEFFGVYARGEATGGMAEWLSDFRQHGEAVAWASQASSLVQCRLVDNYAKKAVQIMPKDADVSQKLVFCGIPFETPGDSFVVVDTDPSTIEKQLAFLVTRDGVREAPRSIFDFTEGLTATKWADMPSWAMGELAVHRFPGIPEASFKFRNLHPNDDLGAYLQEVPVHTIDDNADFRRQHGVILDKTHFEWAQIWGVPAAEGEARFGSSCIEDPWKKLLFYFPEGKVAALLSVPEGISEGAARNLPLFDADIQWVNASSGLEAAQAVGLVPATPANVAESTQAQEGRPLANGQAPAVDAPAI